jgi:hypothetical protein
MTVPHKDFEDDFYKLLDLLIKKVPFAFNRFSDGELFIFQNKELKLGDNLIKVGEKAWSGPYKKEDHKHFEPSKHSFYRDRLFEAFLHRQNFYFKGISCACCVGQENLDWQLEQLQESKSDPHLTWANLLVNGNYSKFVNEMFPHFASYKTIFICHESADLSALPFLVKDFRVGYNAMINDYEKIDQIKRWVAENDIIGHLFLFSASSFSKMAIHQLYKDFPQNTYIDIGTTINSFIGMSVERQYLGDYWYEKPSPADIYKICVW